MSRAVSLVILRGSPIGVAPCRDWTKTFWRGSWPSMLTGRRKASVAPSSEKTEKAALGIAEEVFQRVFARGGRRWGVHPDAEAVPIPGAAGVAPISVASCNVGIIISSDGSAARFSLVRKSSGTDRERSEANRT